MAPQTGIPERARIRREAAKKDAAAKLTREAKTAYGIEGVLQDRNFWSWQGRGQGTDEAKATVLEWCRNIKDTQTPWLAFCGKTGTGKSHLAVAAANEIIEDDQIRMSVRYIKLIGLMRRIRSAYSPRAMQTEEQVVLAFQRVGFLIIDEFGLRDMLTDWESATIDDILDVRWEQRKPTIIITNRTANDFFAMAGERIESRFADLGKILNFTWPDYRVESRRGSTGTG